MAKLQEFTIQLKQNYDEILSYKCQNQASQEASKLRLRVERDMIEKKTTLAHKNMFIEDCFCDYTIANIMSVIDSLSCVGGKPKSRKFCGQDKIIFDSQKAPKMYHLRSDQWAEVLLENSGTQNGSKLNKNREHAYPVVLDPNGDLI